MIEWRFKPSSRDDMDVDPVQGEFFTTRDVDNISNAVVREGIQNALDEKSRDDESRNVKVRIAISGDKYAIPPENYMPLLETLMPHLKAKGSGLQSLPDLGKSMKYLVFEDFNTKGLEGNPKEPYVENIKDGQPHNFYYFWRNVGRSGKTDDQLGRWGLGKTVFPASSAINTFWGVTVRKSDGKKLLMGQSILRTHNREDEKTTPFGYKPYGMYGNYTTNDCFAEPIEATEEVKRFENLFRLQRNNEPGFSIIVPFVTDEISINHLAYSVIEQYFYPILEGKLEVHIESEDEHIILNRINIASSIEKIDYSDLGAGDDNKKIRSRENLNKLFELAKWTFDLSQDQIYTLKNPDIKSTPRWTKSLFADEELLSTLRDKFENGERVAFSIPIKYQPVGSAPVLRRYHAYLEKDLSLTKSDNLFVRDGITISGIASQDKGLTRGIVIIQDTDLARMLGDSENPAHTEWQADSRNFKGKYEHGKEILVFIKNTLKRIYENLQRPPEGLQKDLLLDFFSLAADMPDEPQKKDKPDINKKGDDESEGPELGELKGIARPYLVEKTSAGIKIIKNPKAESVPESIHVKMGYDVPRGNPIKSYQELDFDLSKAPIVLESQGVYFTKQEKNELEFTIENKDQFEITLTGFDEKRDLFLKIQ